MDTYLPVLDEIGERASAVLAALKGFDWVRPADLSRYLGGSISIWQLVRGDLPALIQHGLVQRREYLVPAVRGVTRPRKTTTIIVEYRYRQPVDWPETFWPKPRPVEGARLVKLLDR